MQVGDLVRHHSSRAFGTIVDLRKNPWDLVETLALVYWMESDERVLHPVGTLEIVCK